MVVAVGTIESGGSNVVAELCDLFVKKVSAKNIRDRKKKKEKKRLKR
jgi:hypothetical protein